MAKERSIYRVDLTSKAMKPLESRSAASLGTKERDIENLLVMNPGLLFTEPSAVLIIGQEISGESIADVLAVDSQGNLIVVEIKRGSSDRATVGQILDYAAELSTWNYNDFDERWRQRRTKADAADLFEHFKVYIENPDFDRQKFLAERKLFILASAADEGVVRIIGWLRDTYNVPIQFVPFQFSGGTISLFARHCAEFTTRTLATESRASCRGGPVADAPTAAKRTAGVLLIRADAARE